MPNKDAIETTGRPMTNRSNEFIKSFQVDAVCDALRFVIGAQLEPGPVTKQVLKRLRDEFIEVATGRAVEVIPEITDEMSGVDLLVAGEVLRATLISFLTPEEREERAPFGLHPQRPR